MTQKLSMEHELCVLVLWGHHTSPALFLELDLALSYKKHDLFPIEKFELVGDNVLFKEGITQSGKLFITGEVDFKHWWKDDYLLIIFSAEYRKEVLDVVNIELSGAVIWQNRNADSRKSLCLFGEYVELDRLKAISGRRIRRRHSKGYRGLIMNLAVTDKIVLDRRHRAEKLSMVVTPSYIFVSISCDKTSLG